MVILGCNKPQPLGAKPKKPAENPPQELKASQIEESARSRTGKHELLFKIRYDQATIQIGSKGLVGGQAKGIEGEFYRASKVTSTFRAEEGRVNRATQTLELFGNVVIHSREPAATLRCDRMRYESDRKVIKASGNVTFKLRSGAVGTLPEAWTNPNLDVIATPSLFGRAL